jgi:hypothetical protein
MTNKKETAALNMRRVEVPKVQEGETLVTIMFNDGDVERHPQSIAEFFKALGWAKEIDS